jgi:hypothetical protein
MSKIPALRGLRQVDLTWGQPGACGEIILKNKIKQDKIR